MIIGITGGIGSGKTTLARLLRRHGYMVYDTDYEAKRLQNKDEQLVADIKALFGKDVYKDGKLNRKAVADVVFHQPNKLKQLSDLVHPAVIKDFQHWKQQFRADDIAFMESAIIFEADLVDLVDKIILMTAPEEIRIQRVMDRDKISEEAVKARIKNQIPDAIKATKSDLVIDSTQGLPENVLDLVIMR